jgi:hypothetical protein
LLYYYKALFNNYDPGDIPSPETQNEQQYYRSSVPLRVPIPRETSRGTGSQAIPVREAGNNSLQPGSNAGIPNDEHSFYLVSNHEMEDMRWDSTSASQISANMSPINGFSRSNSSFLENHPYGEASIMSPSSIVFQSARETPTSDIGGLSQEIVESIELPLHSHPDSIEIEDHLPTERASASNSGKSTKKIKSAPNRSATRPSKPTQLDEYILLEKARCQAVGIPDPETGLDLAITQAFNVPPIIDDTITKLKMLYYGIASPESLAGLRELLRVQRQLFAGKEVMPRDNLSPAERVKTIDRLNEKIAYYNLLKRCHVYQLFSDYGAGGQRTSDGFINNTTHSITTRASPQSGNPNHLENSRVTKLILSELYPEFKQDSPEYKKKERFVGDLRKLGERFHLLVEKFDYGILGLLPLPADEPTSQPLFSITNSLQVILYPMSLAWLTILGSCQYQTTRSRTLSCVSINCRVMPFVRQAEPFPKP